MKLYKTLSFVFYAFVEIPNKLIYYFYWFIIRKLKKTQNKVDDVISRTGKIDDLRNRSEEPNDPDTRCIFFG